MLVQLLLKLLLIALIFIKITVAQGIKGKDFWLGFPEQLGVAPAIQLEVYLMSEYNTTVSISSPSAGFILDTSIIAHVPLVITLPDSFEVNGTDTISSKGIHITSLEPIFAVAMSYDNGNSDALSVLPTSNLGVAYYVLGYSSFLNHPVYNSGLMIIATEDNTSITITASANIEGGALAGIPFNIILNRGEVYQGTCRLGDISSTSIIGSDLLKPFAVIAHIGCAKIPTTCNGCDNIMEQIYPIKAWDTEFIVPTLKNKAAYILRIIAAQNCTKVTINGATINLNAGEFNESLQNTASYILADKPIFVMQYARGYGCDPQGDPFMVRMNSVNNIEYDIEYNAMQKGGTSNLAINIITETEDTALLIFDGSPVSFTPVIANNKYATASFTIASGIHNVKSDSGFIAYSYGFSTGVPQESYAFSLCGVTQTYSNNAINDSLYFTYTDPLCINDSIFFMGISTDSVLQWVWNFGDSLSGSSNLDTIKNPFHIYNSTGSYEVTLIAQKDCGGYDTSSHILDIDSVIPVYLGNDTTLCMGDSLILNVNYSDIEMLWSTGDTTNSIVAHSAATYSVNLSKGGCSGYDEIMVDIDSCNNDSTITEDSLNVNGHFVYIPNAFSPNQDGFNDEFKITGFGIKSIDLKIFNMTGRLITYSNDISHIWNDYNNKLENNIYVYILYGTYLDGTSFYYKGNINLVK